MTGIYNKHFASSGIISYNPLYTLNYSGLFITGSLHTGGSILNSGFIFSSGKFQPFMDSDNRPDFEKSYDIYVRDHKDYDIKKMFTDAMKIGWSIGKLNNK